MGIALLLRTIVIAPWVAGLVWRGAADAVAVVLVIALAAVWAVPMLRRAAATGPRVSPAPARLR